MRVAGLILGLVSSLERDRAAFTIALFTVTLAHTLGLLVVAEGVDTLGSRRSCAR